LNYQKKFETYIEEIDMRETSKKTKIQKNIKEGRSSR